MSKMVCISFSRPCLVDQVQLQFKVHFAKPGVYPSSIRAESFRFLSQLQSPLKCHHPQIAHRSHAHMRTASITTTIKKNNGFMTLHTLPFLFSWAANPPYQ